MGLKDAGYPARDYSNNRKRIAVKLYEGNLLFDDSSFDEFGRMTHSWKTQTPMHIGQYVELHEDSNPRDIIVKPAEKAYILKIVPDCGNKLVNPKQYILSPDIISDKYFVKFNLNESKS